MSLETLDFATLGVELRDTTSMAREMLVSPEATRDGRTARTLAKSAGLTAVLTVLRGGKSISEHAAPGPVIIVPLLGTPVFKVGDSRDAGHAVPPGTLLLVGKGKTHEVTAAEDCAFLILIGAQA